VAACLPLYKLPNARWNPDERRAARHTALSVEMAQCRRRRFNLVLKSCGAVSVSQWLHKADSLIRVLLQELFRIDINVIIDLLLIERRRAMLFDCSILLCALAASIISGWCLNVCVVFEMYCFNTVADQCFACVVASCCPGSAACLLAGCDVLCARCSPGLMSTSEPSHVMSWFHCLCMHAADTVWHTVRCSAS
jgi:hypothetical protein